MGLDFVTVISYEVGIGVVDGVVNGAGIDRYVNSVIKTNVGREFGVRAGSDVGDKV